MDKRVKRFLLQICFLSLDITKKSKSDVFLNYSGHTNQFDIKIYINGWEKEKEWDYEEVIYLDEKLNSVEITIRKLWEIKQLLIGLKSK